MGEDCGLGRVGSRLHSPTPSWGADLRACKETPGWGQAGAQRPRACNRIYCHLPETPACSCLVATWCCLLPDNWVGPAPGRREVSPALAPAWRCAVTLLALPSLAAQRTGLQGDGGTQLPPNVPADSFQPWPGAPVMRIQACWVTQLLTLMGDARAMLPTHRA